MSILKVENLSYYYQDGEIRRNILKNANFTFEKGKFYGIIGNSGSGKTTFLALVTGLDLPKEGDVFFDNNNIKYIGYGNFRRNNVGIVFQSYNLIPYLTALENVLVSMSITDNKLPADKKQTALNLLEYIGISNTMANRLVTKLSGGEQQRVAIARALATNVDIIIADEPTGNLDEEMEAEIVDIFKKLAHEHNKCIIVVTHSLEVAEQADRVIRLKKGIFDYKES